MTCRMIMNSSKNIKTEIYPPMISLLKAIFRIPSDSFLILQVIGWQQRILLKMCFLNYRGILKNSDLSHPSPPISTGSISIQPIAGLREINGEIYYTLIKHQKKVRGILSSKMSGPEKNYGMQLLSYQINNGSL